MDASKTHTDHSLLMCIKEGTFIFFTFVYFACVCICAYTHAMTHTWRSGDSLLESVLLFHHEYPEHQTQAVRLVSTNLDSLSILVIPEKEILAHAV